MKTQLFTLAAAMVTSGAFAQCPESTAMDTLNINQVSAIILNGGDLHWDLNDAGYEVPKGSGKNSIFASALWMGGIDAGGQLKVAGQTYRQSGNDFWPGPLDTISASVDAATCTQYDKIWKINRYKIEEFKYYWTLGKVQNGTYIPDAAILSWPGNGDISKGYSKELAPYVDVNNNGVYDPIKDGDYPKIKGDQMLWTVFNDKGNIHTATGGNAIGAEIHASAYAYTCPSIDASRQAINYTTLYHYEIINRSTYQLDSFYFGYLQDGDLGCYHNDYVGCNPQENYGYIYNGDDDDAQCMSKGYGLHPPILSTIMLKTPLQNAMSHFMYYENSNSVLYGNPSGPQHYYNYLRGKWGNGSSMTYGSNGFGGSTPANYMYPDFPYDSTGWSEITAGNIPQDRRFVMSSGPFTFLPGAKVDFDFAIVWSRDTNLAHASKAYFDKNLKDNLLIKKWFLQDSFPSCLPLPLGVKEENVFANTLIISPNPVQDKISIHNNFKTSDPVFDIMDVTGKKVITSKEKQINISGLSRGLYLLKVTDGELIFSKKFIKK